MVGLDAIIVTAAIVLLWLALVFHELNSSRREERLERTINNLASRLPEFTYEDPEIKPPSGRREMSVEEAMSTFSMPGEDGEIDG